jgi:hypothetical protein
MKLPHITNTIDRIGNVAQENTFKMKSSRKAFQILSDLYSDKPLAIVRELGCNAMDSHTMAGHDKPFHIHLPNSLEPWLIIQDFGTGISHENIYNIYTVYFESTKTESNNQIGCLGLGSKSPFCYTDTFTITSITNGVKRIYNAFFNEQSTPAIALVSTTDTNESNGVAIQIPIQQKDFTSFHDAVKRAFRFFDVKPTITGGMMIWDEDKPLFEGEGWKSFEKLGYQESYAIMGGVTYPIDISKVDRKYYGMLAKGGLVIHFGMGEVDFTPSREALSYHEHTIKALEAKLEYIKSDFASRINTMIADAPNVFDAIHMVYNLKTKFAYIDGMNIADSIMWKGLEIGDPIKFIREIIKSTTQESCVTYYKPAYYKQKISTNIMPSLESNSKWYIDDLGKGSMSRIKQYVRDNENQKICLFTDEAHFALLTKGFPKDIFNKTSDLPKFIPPAKKKRMSNPNSVQKVKGAYNVYTIGDTSVKSWTAEEIDPNDSNVDYPKYYLVKNKENWDFSFEIKGIKKTINDKNYLMRVMQFMGIDTSELVMVGERNVKNLPKSCKEFVKYANDNIDLSYDDGVADAFYYSSHVVNTIQSHKNFSLLNKKNCFVIFINTIVENCKKYEKFKFINPIIEDELDDRSKVTKIKTENKAYHHLANKMGTYSWEVDTLMDIVLALDAGKIR